VRSWATTKLRFEEIENEVRELKTKLDDQQATIEGKDTEIKLVMEKLTATKEALALLRCAPPAFQKLADGSIKFQVTLDTDAAAPLLSRRKVPKRIPQCSFRGLLERACWHTAARAKHGELVAGRNVLRATTRKQWPISPARRSEH